jgi:hypothetical protein
VPSKQNNKRRYAAKKPTMDEFLTSRSQLNQVSTDFLKTDLETGLTFATIAKDTSDPAKRARNRKNARKAYDVVVCHLEQVELKPSDARTISQLLQKLKSDLTALGEAFA